MADYEYPRDEFDELASRRAIRGTHRRKESNVKWWVALVVILVVSPLLGWGIVQWAGARHDPVTAPTQVESSNANSANEGQTEDQGKGESGENNSSSTDGNASSDKEAQAKQETPSPEATPNLASEVLVLNGAGIKGLAAQYKAKLSALGYTNVSVDNYGRAQPAVSTVYYSSENDAVTARAIAQNLGIDSSHVTMSAQATGTNARVVVVLRSDIG